MSDLKPAKLTALQQYTSIQAAKTARAKAFPAHEFEEQGGKFFRGKGCMRTALDIRNRTSNVYTHVSVARDDGHGKAHGTFALADWLCDMSAADLHEYEVLHEQIIDYLFFKSRLRNILFFEDQGPRTKNKSRRFLENH